MPGFYQGEFCVYAMSDSALKRPAPGLLSRVFSTLSLSSGTSAPEPPDYPTLFGKIRALDGDSGALGSGSDIRAHLSLHPFTSEIGPHNKFWVLGDASLDAFLSEIQRVDDIPFPGGTRHSGIVARLLIPEDRVGVEAFDGELTLTRVWADQVDMEADEDEGMKESATGELFEGRFRLKVEHNMEAWSEGYGEGVECDFGFWAVRTSEM